MKKLIILLLLCGAFFSIAQHLLLENTFTNWVGNLEQVDDVTLIGIRV